MGVWVKDTSGRYTLIGGGLRTALIAERSFPADSALKLQLARPNANHHVFAVVLSSKDGRSCYEVGLVGANIVIRSVRFGDPLSVTEWATAAHGLNVALPFFLEVRYQNGTIEARLNGSTTAAVSFAPGTSGSPTYAGYKHFGFVSNVNNALVATAQLCDLIPQRVNRADLLCAACGGDAFLVEGQSVRLLRAGVFNASGDVGMVEFEQKVYAVDGAHAWIIDPITLAVDKWTPTAGSLPGATLDDDGNPIPGTTTATIICVYRGRIWLAGMPEDPQNIFACAVNQPLDWDTGAADIPGNFGKAFGFTPAQIGKIGQPVTCLVRSTRNSLVIGCNNSTWELIGDPSTQLPELTEILNKAGISGKDAATSIAEGRLVVHTTAGAYLLPALGGPIPISSPVLTEGINIDREDLADYIVQVRRDPQRDQVYFFLTRREADGTATHVTYDERVGGYNPQQGGWEPDDYAERFGPTASTPEPYQGQVVLGTRNGYLMVHDDDLNQDDGETVTWRVPLSLMEEAKLSRETILHKFNILPVADAVVKYRVWGALTPQKVYGYDSGRYLMASGTVGSRRQEIIRKVRAPAVMIELYGDTDAIGGVEDADAVTTAGRIVTRRDLSAAAAPGAPCTPPFYSSGSIIIETDTGTGAGPGPGTDTGTELTPGTGDTGPGYTTGFTAGEGTDFPLSSSSSSNGESATGLSDESIPQGHTATNFGDTAVHCTIVTDGLGDQHTHCFTPSP